MSLFEIALPLTVSAICTAVLVPASILLAKRFGMLDIPDARKVHVTPTPRLGGIAMYVGIVAGVLASMTYLWTQNALGHSEVRKLFSILGAVTIIFAVGLVDDFRSVSSRFKLISLLGAAAMVGGSGILITGAYTPGYNQVFAVGPVLSWIFTILFVAGMAVAINFVDGLDGLAGGLVLLASIVLSIFCVSSPVNEIDPAPLALVGATAAFLLFNWHPAKVFMGDAGSMSLGFLVAVCMVHANGSVGTMRSMVVPGLALSVPVLDGILTIFRRRYLQRRSIFSAERGHIHHRLLDRGLRHPHVVLTIHGFSIMAVCIGLISLSFDGWSTLGGLAIMIPLLWGIFRLAGSVRTSEMVTALRSKRHMDRTAKRYHKHFEELQLELHKAVSFSEWWDCICKAAERLDFVTADLTVERRDTKPRVLSWETKSSERWACSNLLHATLPVLAPLDPSGASKIKLAVDACTSYECASYRLGLFARLISETSLAVIHRRESSRFHRLHHSTAPSDPPLTLVDLKPVGIFPGLRVAVVQDFLYVSGGAERVLEQIIDLFPQCDVYALFDFLSEDDREVVRHKPVRTTFIQKLPFARRNHRQFLPLMPFAIEQLDLSGYDLVISSSYLVAKGVITGPDQLHVCYCHSPARYVWDLQHQYLNQSKLGFGPLGLFARLVLHYLRNWDVRSSMGVDQFIANSKFVARRIEKLYRRESVVINPPVDTDQFRLADEKDDFYLVAGRMVPYKRTDLIVSAFAQMPDRRLVIIGDGPELEACRELAGENVQFLGRQPNDIMTDYMQRAKALIFAAEEDFGIVPVEALACGTPVLAYGKGGVTESVVEGEHGLFFHQQTPAAICETIDRFESLDYHTHFAPEKLRERAEAFSQERFRARMRELIEKVVFQRWPTQSQTTSQPADEVELQPSFPNAE